MKQKRPSLAERLVVKLRKLGLPERKAKTLAKGLVPTAQRAKVTGTVTGKLTDRLQKLGLSERKATELAKGLAPLVRSAIKAKAKVKALTLDDVTDEMVNETVTKVTDDAEDMDLDKVAPRVNGHRVRLDLPVVERHTWQRQSVRGIELLRVMDGLTSEATYLVAAVKSDEGIVAVRQLGTGPVQRQVLSDHGVLGLHAGRLSEARCDRVSGPRVVSADALRPEWGHQAPEAVGSGEQARAHPVAVTAVVSARTGAVQGIRLPAQACGCRGIEPRPDDKGLVRTTPHEVKRKVHVASRSQALSPAPKAGPRWAEFPVLENRRERKARKAGVGSREASNRLGPSAFPWRVNDEPCVIAPGMSGGGRRRRGRGRPVVADCVLVRACEEWSIQAESEAA